MNGSVGGKVAGGEGANVVPNGRVGEVIGSHAGCEGVGGRPEEGRRDSSGVWTSRGFREHRDAISDADATARERRARTSKNIDAEGIRFAVSDPRDARRESVLEGADAGE